MLLTLLISAFTLVANAQPDGDAAKPVAAPSPSVEATTPASLAGMAPGQVVRVGGDTAAKTSEQNGHFVSGRCKITTPLPIGYPAPTPPGAIDIKRYPTVRRAQITGDSPADVGMNVGFFPLFSHIKRRDIPMTAPVEMEYQGLAGDSTSAPAPAAGAPGTQDGAKPKAPASRWTMAFLYRSTDEGEPGSDKADARVQVVDAPGVLVLSLGMRGSYGRARVEQGLTRLNEWLAAHPEWTAAGDARALYYNGPDTPSRDLWLEVQLPIALKATPAKTGETGP